METWGGVASALLKKYLVLIYVTSIEIKIEVKASWLLYILYSPPIFKNKRCYVHAKHYKLSYEPGTIVSEYVNDITPLSSETQKPYLFPWAISASAANVQVKP